MSRSLIAVTVCVALLNVAGYAAAENIVAAADSGHDNTGLDAFSSAPGYVYSAEVPEGGSYAGISSTVGSGPNVLGSTAALMAGDNSGDDTTVTMQWRNRAEVERAGTAEHPPLPDWAAYLASNVLDLQGISGPFALQIHYSQAVESTYDEQFDAPSGQLYLGWLDPASGYWVNAANFEPRRQHRQQRAVPGIVHGILVAAYGRVARQLRRLLGREHRRH